MAVSFLPAAFYSTGSSSSPYGITAADFNGDGKLDLAATGINSGDVAVLLGNGDGTFQAAAFNAVGINPTGIAAADFTGNGKIDLAVADSNGSDIAVLLGNGDGTFQAAIGFSAGSNPVAIVAADFNDDGKIDLAATDLSSGNVVVLLGNGDGTFQAAVPFPVGYLPFGIVAADFNGDGKIDLAVADQGSNNVAVLLGNGDGTFQAASFSSVGSSPAELTVADLNGDGKIDLAVTNNDSGDVAVLLGNGDGTFQTASFFPVGSLPEGVAAADFNGDGKLDLVIAVSGSNSVAVLLGNGDGTFQAPVLFPVGTFPSEIVVADFNSDGKIDLAVTDTFSDNVAVLINSISECALLVSDPDSRISLGLDTPGGPNNPIPDCLCYDVCVRKVTMIASAEVHQSILYSPIAQCRLGPDANLPLLVPDQIAEIYVTCAGEVLASDCVSVINTIKLLAICISTIGTAVIVPFTLTLTHNTFFDFPSCTKLDSDEVGKRMKEIDGSCKIIQLKATVNNAGDAILIDGKIIDKLWKHENLHLEGLKPYGLTDAQRNSGYSSITIRSIFQDFNHALRPCN